MTTVISRKDFFRLGFLRVAQGAEGLVRGAGSALGALSDDRSTAPRAAEPSAPSFLRPPGALGEAAFLARCTRCDECVKACPHLVIRKAGPELGEAISGTPMILPKENPCLMCADWPCVAACETGALVMPEPGAFTRIGEAKVDETKCYLAHGHPCDYCHTECPERPRAILASWPGLPARVETDICNGCGKCAHICPAGAIVIEDTRAPMERTVLT